MGLAIFLGCAAATVSPIGILMPLALIATMLWQRNWSAAARCCVVSGSTPGWVFRGDHVIARRGRVICYTSLCMKKAIINHRIERL
jgi:hypothetical protein